MPDVRGGPSRLPSRRDHCCGGPYATIVRNSFPGISARRSRAEAAILEAKGDVDGALNKLAETETAIRALPKNAQRETVLLLLQRWKSELCGC